MDKSNSWKSLKETFKGTKNVPQKRSPFNQMLTKRIRKIQPLSLSPATKYIDLTKLDDGKENIITKSNSNKRPASRLANVTQQTIQLTHIFDADDDNDGVIYHDPDYDDIPLPSSTPKSSKNIQLPFTTTRQDILETSIRTPNRSNKTNNITIKQSLANLNKTFTNRSLSKELEQLENSIIDSDEDENNASDCTSKSITAHAPKAKRHYFEPVIDASESPNATQNEPEIFIDTQSSGRTIETVSSQRVAVTPSAPQQSPKRKRVTKGGLAKSLQDTINRAKSNLSFWLNERQSDLIKSGEMVEIVNIEEQYGRGLLHCQCSNDEIRIICLNSNNRKLHLLTVGKFIEVEFDSDGYVLDPVKNTKIYSNVYKIMFK